MSGSQCRGSHCRPPQVASDEGSRSLHALTTDTDYSETCCHLDLGLVKKNVEGRIKKVLGKAMRNRKVIHYVYITHLFRLCTLRELNLTEFNLSLTE